MTRNANNTDNTLTFNVLAYKVEEVEAKLSRLARKAQRLGLAAPTITKGAAYVEETTRNLRRVFVTRVPVTLNIPTLRVSGYEFLVALDHTEAGNVTRAFVPGDYTNLRHAPNTCQHCGTRRARKSTFILRNEKTGETIQVGSTCIVDFLGHDAAGICTRATMEHDLQVFLGECSDDFDPDAPRPSRPKGVDLAELLGYVATVMRAEGWVSRAKARDEGRTSTSGLALEIRDRTEAQLRAAGLGHLTATREDFVVGKAAMEWMIERDDIRSDFDHNMQVIARTGFATWKQIGIAAYIVKAHERELNRQAARQAEEARRNAPGRNPQHVGTVGKRETFEGLTLVRTSTFDGHYGPSTLHVFEDANGSEVVWFKSGEGTICDRGQTVAVVATVKGHGERNGRPQTKVNRVKLA